MRTFNQWLREFPGEIARDSINQTTKVSEFVITSGMSFEIAKGYETIYDSCGREYNCTFENNRVVITQVEQQEPPTITIEFIGILDPDSDEYPDNLCDMMMY